MSYYEHNKLTCGPELLRQLADGRSIALVTDAGTPGISDPGLLLVREARARGIAVVPIPGPAAVITALSASGLGGDGFVFGGFLPIKPGKRINRLTALRAMETTVVLYESPHRIVATLHAIAEAELLEDVRDVRLHRRLADVELPSDLGVREAACDEAQDVPLASAELVDLLRRRRARKPRELLDHALRDGR